MSELSDKGKLIKYLDFMKQHAEILYKTSNKVYGGSLPVCKKIQFLYIYFSETVVWKRNFRTIHLSNF
jgi:hypothetical protein